MARGSSTGPRTDGCESMFDRCAFEERAAIAEFDGGLSRFRAETLAAEAQGLSRWQAMEEIRGEERERNSAERGNRA